MGFFKKLFGGDDEGVSEEIRAARARHGIEADDLPEGASVAGAGRKSREQEEYDPWEDVRAVRSQFFFGGLYRRRPKIKTDHDAIRKELEEATRKREERYQQKQEEKRLKKEEKEQKKGKV